MENPVYICVTMVIRVSPSRGGLGEMSIHYPKIGVHTTPHPRFPCPLTVLLMQFLANVPPQVDP